MNKKPPIQCKGNFWALLACYYQDPSLITKYPLDPLNYRSWGLDFQGLVKVFNICAERKYTELTPVIIGGIMLEDGQGFTKRMMDHLNDWLKKEVYANALDAKLENVATYYELEQKCNVINQLMKKNIDVTYYYVTEEDGYSREDDVTQDARHRFEAATSEEILDHYKEILNDIKFNTVNSFDPFKGYNPSELPDAKKPIEWLVEGLYQKNTLDIVVGPGKSGKSQLCLMYAYFLTNKLPILNRKTAYSDVLYIDYELRNNEIYDRWFKADCYAQEYWKQPTGKEYKVFPMNYSYYNIDEVLRQTRRYLKDHPECQVVFFDNFQCFYGGNANDVSQVRACLEKLKKLREICTVFLVCHTNKAIGEKGGSDDPLYAVSGCAAFGDAADEVTSIELKADGVILHTKGRHVHDTVHIACTFNEDTYWQHNCLLDESTIKEIFGAPTIKSKEELQAEFPDLCDLIGPNGASIATIKKTYPDETDESMKAKGFFYSGRNKSPKFRDGIITKRYYYENPYKG